MYNNYCACHVHDHITRPYAIVRVLPPHRHTVEPLKVNTIGILLSVHKTITEGLLLHVIVVAGLQIVSLYRGVLYKRGFHCIQ